MFRYDKLADYPAPIPRGTMDYLMRCFVDLRKLQMTGNLNL